MTKTKYGQRIKNQNRCQAITKDKTQCLNRKRHGNYCGKHLDISEDYKNYIQNDKTNIRHRQEE